MNKLQRFLKAARNISPHPLTNENKQYIQMFEQFSQSLFNTEIVEIYSSNIFPETLKFKDGSKYLIWDCAYWNIFNNVITLYFMASTAQDEILCEWIKQRLEAEIYYFLALKMEFTPELSTELSRSYNEAMNHELSLEISYEELSAYTKKKQVSLY